MYIISRVINVSVIIFFNSFLTVSNLYIFKLTFILNNEINYAIPYQHCSTPCFMAYAIHTSAWSLSKFNKAIYKKR